MPAPIPLTSSVRAHPHTARSKVRAPPPQSKKTRIVRRRGRAKDVIGSDDEIEREVATDSESEDQSSLDSASDSDTEPASEVIVPNGHSRVLTPGMTRSSAEISLLDKEVSVDVEQVNGVDPSFFSTAGNWSEMVADENVNGPADLPVIDFADFVEHSADQRMPNASRSHKGQKASKRQSARNTSQTPSAPVSTAERRDESLDREPVASTSRQPSEPPEPRRLAGQSARQAYQQRLDADPSYVPTVGEFWGHDDRLLDKDLRSLSGWWRGRWQGRGRGRGFDRGFPMRGRGRGGFFGPPPIRVPSQDVAQSNDNNVQPRPPSNVPPIEQPWTHDGFEEMRQKEETRRTPQQFQHAQGFGFRGGRGGFVAGRGRGSFTRGGFSPSPTRFSPSPTVRGRGLPFSLPSGRVWFAMKPERVWTKQHDGFLHFDPALKARPGHGQGLRVKIPGNQSQLVRAQSGTHSATPQPMRKQSIASSFGSEDGEKTFVVCIPTSSGKPSMLGHTPPVSAVEESLTTVEEPPIDEVFTVRPQLQARTAIPNPPPAPTPNVNGTGSLPPSSHVPSESSTQHLDETPVETENSSLGEAIWTRTGDVRPSEPSAEAQELASTHEPRHGLPTLPPLQTVFSPQPSSSYVSPYPYGATLPPGVAINHHGMPYEIATGRPVYLQPPTMYNHRPIMHTPAPHPGMPFVPGHVRHHSTVSPDFLQPPSQTPPINGFMDPSTGAPMFSLPRQSSRVEIRPPTEQAAGKLPSKAIQRPSGLRTAAATFEPSTPNGQQVFPVVGGSSDPGSLPTYASADNGSPGADGHSVDPAVMAYSSYQQPYYYPEQYGYSQYVDMSQVPYDIYTPDPHGSQSTAYY